MECRRCGACCVALSISSPIPGMQGGKPAGVACVHLNEQNLCGLFGKPERPRICSLFPPMPDTCGADGAEALALMTAMEKTTSSSGGH